MQVYNLSCINVYKSPDDGSQIRPKHIAAIKLIQTIVTYVPYILCGLLSRSTNAHHIYIHTHIYMYIYTLYIYIPIYICCATLPLYIYIYIHSFIHSFISIQPQRPGWQEPEPSHVTGVALAHCILGKFLGVVCH